MQDTLRQLRGYFEKTKDNLVGRTVYVANKKELMVYECPIREVVIGYDEHEQCGFLRFEFSRCVRDVTLSEREFEQGYQGAGEIRTIHLSREEAKNELRDTLHGWRRQVENL